MRQTCLVLADGTVFPGYGAGTPAPTVSQLPFLSYEEAPCGEVVFNTTMGAYHEIFTDPSYAGQIVVMTSVHIGNYGTDPAWNEMCSDLPACRGIIAREIYSGPVPPGRIGLPQMLDCWNMSALSAVDTRALTVHLRNFGATLGVMVQPDNAASDSISADGDSYAVLSSEQIESVLAWLSHCPAMSDRDLISSVASRSIRTIFGIPKIRVENRLHMVLVDYGVKQSIVKELTIRGVDVSIVPPGTDLKALVDDGIPMQLPDSCKPVMRSVDAVFLSNGPGDPAFLKQEIELVRTVVGSIPVLGICLGHQLIAHALGGTTEKHRFGHHGGNHPVRDTVSGRVFVTAQNHGYCVVASSLPSSAVIWFVNANDGTVEGMYDTSHAVMSVQFHPEASPGPREGTALFDRFIRFVEDLRTSVSI